MDKISLIIPVYNTEKYIDECLISVENQTIDKRKLEVIIINDGSEDKSLNIIKKYISKNNWKLINQKNSGLSISRNNGIDISTGNYIMFLDSDDYLDKDTLKDMYETIKKEKSDLVIGKINAFDSKGYYGYYFDKYISKNETFYYKDKLDIIATTSVCCKLYSRKILKGIKFIPNLKHEDHNFTAQIMLKNIKITTINKYYYYRRYREGEKDSIMQNLNKDTFNDLVKNYEILSSQVTLDDNVIKYSIRKMLNYIINNIVNNKKEAKEKVYLYIDLLKENKIIDKNYYSNLKTYTKFYYLIGSFYKNIERKLK